MRIAYADPPYPGQAVRHYGAEAAADGRVAREVNHPLLIAHLCADFPDGWALSTSSVSLRYVLPLCPEDARVAAWVKPFHVFKKGVRPAYAWEPLIFRGGRNDHPAVPLKGGEAITPRDWLSANVTLRKGVRGAKPPEFVRWLITLFNLTPADELVDLFPGSGAIGDGWDRFTGELRFDHEELEQEVLAL